MEDKSMTARICAFSRAYHSMHNEVKIFDDPIAKKLLSQEEYAVISENMSNGIQYFNKEFVGNKKEALRWIVDNQLSQTPLARAAFAEKSLEIAVMHGVEQYISTLSSIIPVNSSIVFDYPNEHYFYSQRKHSNLAKSANEEMKAILEKYNMQIFEHLDSEQMTSQYFSEYNSANSSYEMKAQSNVNYCLCVKK